MGSLHIKVLDLTDRTASELATAMMAAPEVASCLVAVVQLGVWAQQPEVQALSLSATKVLSAVRAPNEPLTTTPDSDWIKDVTINDEVHVTVFRCGFRGKVGQYVAGECKLGMVWRQHTKGSACSWDMLCRHWAGSIGSTIRMLRAEAWRDDASFMLVFVDQRYSLRLRQVFDRRGSRNGREEWADRAAEALTPAVSSAGYTLERDSDGPLVCLPVGASALFLFSWSRALHRHACSVVATGLCRLSVGRRCGGSSTDVAFSAVVPQ